MKTYTPQEIEQFTQAKTILFRAAEAVAKLKLPYDEVVKEFEFQLQTMKPYNKPRN